MRVVKAFSVIVLLAAAVVLFQNLAHSVNAAQLELQPSENIPAAASEVETALELVPENQSGCGISACQPAQSIPQAQPLSAPAAQPVQAVPLAVEPSRLPDYLTKFMSEWKPTRSGGCLEVWDFTPSTLTSQRWLLTPSVPEGLRTSTSYYILAGMLIRNKLVDASQCPAGGLIDPNGTNLAANNCGVDVAFSKVTAWQNRFDSQIYNVAQTTQIPAILLKNFIRQESQFWPGQYSSNGEVGLGQMTNAGADTLLRWSPDLYQDLCAKSFSRSACEKGYSQLSAGERATLQGAILQVVNASCPDCTETINPQQANFSVGVFAEALSANCKQVDQVVRDVAKVETASMVSTYSDLWKITLYNYNAGSGCMENAVKRAWKQNPEGILSWERVQNYLDMDCLGGVKYVDGITK